MYNYAVSLGLDNGNIDTIPEIPGLGLHKDGHFGVYIGNGKVIEESGFANGCIETKLSSKKWLHWFKLPVIEYGATSTTTPAVSTLGNRTLKKGSSGADVKELQTLLNKLMNAGLVVDGEYGTATVNAVRKFQSKYEQTVDGIYGKKTHQALMSAIGDAEPVAPTPTPEPEPTPASNILVTTGSVNVRAGNDTKYAILTSVPEGTKLVAIVDENKKPLISDNGWYAVESGDSIGWVSKKYIG